MSERVISWDFRPNADGWDDIEPDAVVWVDVEAFDRAWRLTDHHIVPGGANGQADRYARAGRWFAAHQHSDMLCATAGPGGVFFIDGRHRFAWLRDQGVEALAMQVAPGLRDLFIQGFEAKTYVTVLRTPSDS